MNEAQIQSIGATFLRISLGIVLLAHSLYLKLMVFTLPGTAEFFVSIGLPSALAYITFLVEVAAGIALIIGYQVRIAALTVIPFLLGATWAHASNGWLFSNPNGGWEYPLFLVCAAIAQVFIGGGYGAWADVVKNRINNSQINT